MTLTSRRSFLAMLAAVAVADPERLIWVPRKKLISIPKPALTTTKIWITESIDRKKVVFMNFAYHPDDFAMIVS